MATAEFWAGFRAAASRLRERADETEMPPCFLPDREAVSAVFETVRVVIAEAVLWLERQVPASDPEPLVLHCPKCGKLHLDLLEPDGTDWSKRSHKTHLCKNTDDGPDTGCGHLWRPKETPTVGVMPPVEHEHGPFISRNACRQLAWDWLRRAGDDGMNTRIQGMKDAHYELIEMVGLGHTTGAEEAARVRLGVWLAARPHRHFLEFKPDPELSGRFREVWTIKLVERNSDVGISDRTTWAEAVTDALTQAERLERESNANRNNG